MLHNLTQFDKIEFHSYMMTMMKNKIKWRKELKNRNAIIILMPIAGNKTHFEYNGDY